MSGLRSTLRRYHIWLGWLIGIPMLFWSVSGVMMVIKPIEEVRGADLLSDPALIALAAPLVAPKLDGLKVTGLALEQRVSGPRWVLTTADGAKRTADPFTGALMPEITAIDAGREVSNRYKSDAVVVTVARTNRNDPPLDLRRPIEAWQVKMSDGAHFYVDRSTGEIVARRTAWWRFYDFMWGLHIMDLQTREDAHNPWLIGFGLTAAMTTVMALILLPMTGRRKKRRKPSPES